MEILKTASPNYKENLISELNTHLEGSIEHISQNRPYHQIQKFLEASLVNLFRKRLILDKQSFKALISGLFSQLFVLDDFLMRLPNDLKSLTSESKGGMSETNINILNWRVKTIIDYLSDNEIKSKYYIFFKTNRIARKYNCNLNDNISDFISKDWINSLKNISRSLTEYIYNNSEMYGSSKPNLVFLAYISLYPNSMKGINFDHNKLYQYICYYFYKINEGNLSREDINLGILLEQRIQNCIQQLKYPMFLFSTLSIDEGLTLSGKEISDLAYNINHLQQLHVLWHNFYLESLE